jgi:hypothetical protein
MKTGCLGNIRRSHKGANGEKMNRAQQILVTATTPAENGSWPTPVVVGLFAGAAFLASAILLALRAHR